MKGRNRAERMPLSKPQSVNLVKQDKMKGRLPPAVTLDQTPTGGYPQKGMWRNPEPFPSRASGSSPGKSLRFLVPSFQS
jgi:hypothetical protein